MGAKKAHGANKAVQENGGTSQLSISRLILPPSLTADVRIINTCSTTHLIYETIITRCSYR
jgi:hypothetical protein